VLEPLSGTWQTLSLGQGCTLGLGRGVRPTMRKRVRGAVTLASSQRADFLAENATPVNVVHFQSLSR